MWKMVRRQGWTVAKDQDASRVSTFLTEFRVQQAGWRHLREYRDVHDPQFWETGLIKMVVTKDKGYFTYWCVS